MEYTIEFGGTPQDVTVRASGLARVSGFRHLYEALFADERFTPGMLVLLDLTELDLAEIPGNGAGEIGRALGEFRERCEGCALAVVCTDPLASALIRRSRLGEDAPGVDVWIACSLEEARAWLESELALRSSSTPTR